MDNAKNYRASGSIIQRTYPHIYATVCNTHSLNLVLQDWYKSEHTEWFREPIDKSRRIDKFILYRQRVLHIPVETRFCTHFYVLEGLLKNKDAIKETSSCTLYRRWEEVQKESVWNKSAQLKIIVNMDLL